MKALVFAAGLGTRLRPLTDTLPKALVPVGGKPLLYHVVRRLKAAGIDEIVVNVHHFPDSIIGYIREQEGFGIRVHISDERDFLRETGGGIAYARPFLEGEPFLVHNVDILSDLDLDWFRAQARPDALATLLVSERQTQRYLLFDGEMRLAGWTNVATGEVKSPYPSLEVSKLRKLAFAGIHIAGRDIFRVMDEDGWSGRFSVIDFYLQECARHPVYGAVPPRLRLVDVGKQETLAHAEAFLQELSQLPH